MKTLKINAFILVIKKVPLKKPKTQAKVKKKETLKTSLSLINY